MTHLNNPYKKILEDILHSRNFDQLLTFADEQEWTRLANEERELLARLYIMQGEKQLIDGDERVIESFKMANRAAPDNPQVLYEQGMVLLKQTHNVSCLKAATHIFQKAIALNPDFFDAWHQMGNVRVLLGVHTQQEEDFLEALAQFQKAEEFTSGKEKESLGHFYHDYGLVWYHLGRKSEEAVDFYNALQLYQKAISFNFSSYKFWNDYGNCLTELSLLLIKPGLIIEAIEKYWNAVKIKSDYFEGWINFSISLHVLYEIHPQEAYFALAEQGFSQASRLDSQNYLLWLKWGQLLAMRGKILKDAGNLFESCKKFEMADQYHKDSSIILSFWSESLLMIAEETEELTYLKQAEIKANKSLEIEPENPQNWALCGKCLTELGRYFDEEEYYDRAFKHFKNGLELFPKEHVLWHGLAMAAYSLGYYRQGKERLEEAIVCCRKAIENGGHAIPQYWNDWGVCFMRFGLVADDKDSMEAALNRFEQAIRLKSSQAKGGVLEPEWIYNYGCALDYLGDYERDSVHFEKSIDVLKKVLDLDPTFDYAYFNLALAYAHYAELMADLESYSLSFKYMGVYLALQPEDGGAWNEWGLSLVDLAHLVHDPGAPDDFRKCLIEAEEKFIRARLLGDKGAVYHLACVQSLLGNLKASLHFLERAKELEELPSIDDLASDGWLDKVRETAEFKTFIERLQYE